jgi:paraquat-inducible protein A
MTPVAEIPEGLAERPATRSAPVIACRECDLLQREVMLSPGETARCRRCGALLYRNTRHGLDRTVAFLLAAAVLFLVANINPIVGLEAQGVLNTTTLLGAVRALLNQDLLAVALLVFVTAILAPAVEVVVMLYLLLPLRFGRVPAGFAAILPVVQEVKRWNMVEVFMLGLLVSLVKLSQFASVVPGPALWSFGGLTILMTAVAASFDPHEIWARADKSGGGDIRKSARAPTATEFGLITCQACGMVSRPARTAGPGHCPRCHARLQLRKTDSAARCWVFLIASYILYVPANLLPILETSSLTGTQQDTIMSGIVSLWDSGSWGIAVIVFIASITVPFFKLIALTFLLISVRGRSAWRALQRARLYRLIRLVGRWSMLDIYVVAILTTLVQFRFLATVEVGPAAFPFGAVVVLTMFAATEFDPRLIWES